MGLKVTLMTGPHKGIGGLRRVWHALHHSIDGLKAAFVHEAAFRQEVVLAALLIPAALWLPASALGKALMIASVLLVLIIELLNSAVEAAVDRISLEQHALAKRAKDAGSAAVLLALVNVVIVWVLVLLKSIIKGAARAAVSRFNVLQANYFFNESRISRSSNTSSAVGAGAAGGSAFLAAL